MFNKSIIKTFLVILPLIMILLPADYFNKGITLCLSNLLFYKECIGCGMTRALMHLIHLDIMEAASFNKLSFVVLPLLLLIYIKMVSWYFFDKKILKWF